jgi:hypothetical protein
MLLVFFNHWSIVYYEFTPDGQTIKILIWWFWGVCGMWYEESDLKWWLQEAGSSITLSVRQFLAKHSIPNLPQPPYSPDFSPLDFFLFPKLKCTLIEEDFRQWKTSSLMRQRIWRWYHKHPLNSASKSEKGGGRGALLHKGTILKGTILNKLYVEKDNI